VPSPSPKAPVIPAAEEQRLLRIRVEPDVVGRATVRLDDADGINQRDRGIRVGLNPIKSKQKIEHLSCARGRGTWSGCGERTNLWGGMGGGGGDAGGEGEGGEGAVAGGGGEEDVGVVVVVVEEDGAEEGAAGEVPLPQDAPPVRRLVPPPRVHPRQRRRRHLASPPEINHRLRFLRSDGDGGVFVFSNATLSDDFAILPLEREDFLLVCYF
jgi:hypothetical protein